MAMRARRSQRLAPFAFSGVGRTIFGFGALAATATPAWAHGDLGPGENPWRAWQWSPEIIIALALAGVVYAAGLRYQTRPDRRVPVLHSIAFYGGLAALGLALLSPIEPIADHVFIVHQVEHMLLRTVGPLLIMLAASPAVLMRGLPNWSRRWLVAPVVGNGVVYRVFGALSHPVAATALFVGTTYFWMIPRYHDIAILDEPVHYLWHVTLLVSGLFFFWRVFDPRPTPLGAALPTRLLMIWFAIMGNIALGFYLSFKETVLYSAYDTMGRLWGLSALTDERFGGLTMWIPGCMMMVVAGLALVHRWGSGEERQASRRAGAVAISRDEAQRRARPKNRALAIGLAGFAAVVLVIAVSAAVIYDRAMGHS